MAFTVATWNVENLFRPGTPGGPSDPAAYDAKLAGLSATIEALGPDVLALQEVGEPAALDDLKQRLSGNWHSAISPDPDARGIRVAFLARLPLGAIEPARSFPRPLAPVQAADDGTTIDAMGRGALRVRVTAAVRHVDLITCHLKSKLLEFGPDRFTPRDEGERARAAAYALFRRAAEAATVRREADRRLDGQGEQRAVVVLGDLNDEPQAATSQLLLGPPGSQIGSGGFGQPDRGDRWRLWNLAPLIPEQRRFSRVFEGRRELIDQILVSRFLVERVTAADTGATDLPSIGADPRARRDARASDHAPVVARFEL